MPSGGDHGKKNAATHGTYSIKTTGELPEARQTPALVARHQEIADNLATPEGCELEQERVTETALLALEAAISWVREKRGEGKALDAIPIFKMIPALVNSAGRQVSSLQEMKAKAGKRQAIDYDALVKELQNHD